MPTYRIVMSVISADHRVKLKESVKKDKELDLARELLKYHEGHSDTICRSCTFNHPQRIDKETEGLRNQWTSRDHSDYSIIKIGKN